MLELPDLDAAPAIGRADDGGVHQLQHRPFAEGMRNDLRPPALFEEEALEEIRGADHPTMTQREAEVRDARVEVVLEALHDGRQLTLVSGHEILAEHAGHAGDAAS